MQNQNIENLLDGEYNLSIDGGIAKKVGSQVNIYFKITINVSKENGNEDNLKMLLPYPIVLELNQNRIIKPFNT